MGATAGPVRFNWRKAAHQADGLEVTMYGAIHCHAWTTGEWKVIHGTAVLAHWSEQSKGSNINEAKQRAQGAAIVQLQLLQSPNT